MKKKLTVLIAAMVIIVAAIALTSCSRWDPPYKGLDKSGSTVSVRYFAGEGGLFLDKSGITIVDVFNLNDYESDGKGNREIPLVSPEAVETRLPQNASASKKMITHEKIENVKLAGWAECDENGTPILDENGEYIFWDFGSEGNRKTPTLKVSENGSYSSENPVLNLVAIWQPYASFEIYVVENGVVSETPYLTLNQLSFINIPYWKDGESEITMGRHLKERSGYTFLEAYADPECTVKLETVDDGSGRRFEPELDSSATEAQVFKIYTTWETGEWYRIYNAKQLSKAADKNGCYRLMNDIDFEGVSWPANFYVDEFNGVFDGGENGYKISNVTYKQISTSSKDNGIFRSIGADAVFRNVTFEGVTVKTNAYKDLSGANYGILAGKIAGGATFDGFTLSGSTLVLTDGFFDMASEHTSVSLVSPVGNTDGISSVGNTCIIEVSDGSQYADWTVSVDADGSVSYSAPDESQGND